MIDEPRVRHLTRPDGHPADRAAVARSGAGPPRRVRLLNVIVIVTGIIAVTVGFAQPVSHPPDELLTPWHRLAAAAGVMALAQLARLRLRVGSGTVNVAWGEAALIVGLYLVPPGWLPSAVFVGTGVAVLLISIFSDRRSAREIAHIASSLSLATALAAAATSAIHPAYGAALSPELALALVVGCLAYLSVTTLLVALTLSLRYRLPFRTLVFRTLHGKLVMFVGNIVVGLSVIGFLERDARWLGLLPPALWLLQQTYAHRLRADDERRAWHQLAEATGSLNQLDERDVARAGVRGALALFGAERVEVDVLRGDDHRRRYSAAAVEEDAEGEVTEADVAEPPAGVSRPADRSGPVPRRDLSDPPRSAPSGQVVTRKLTVAGARVGELRVHYPPSVTPTPRERMALQTFGDALGAALHDAATHRQLRLLEARSTYDAVHDPLTGLANRAALLAKGDTQLRLLPSEQPVALLLLDVNHFKEVNDTLGHAAGDELLQVTARRLRTLCQPGEVLARLGGDEFALFVAPEPAVKPALNPDQNAVPAPTGPVAATGPVVETGPGDRYTPGAVGGRASTPAAEPVPATPPDPAGDAAAGPVPVERAGPTERAGPVESAGLVDRPGFVDRPAPMAVALRRARQITERLAVPTEVAGVQLSVEASVGVVVAPAGAADMTELLRRADIAMYQAKDGGGSVAWYDSARDAASTDQLALLAEMREALAVDDQLVLALQPAVDLATGAPTGVEALIRWRHPRRGALNPGEFVRAVEGSELLAAFTRYVVDKALAAAAEWASQGVPVPISVNISARSLLDPRLPADVGELLRRHGVPPQRLVLEITETVVMSEMEVIDEVLAGLRTAGVQLAVDDFGTGFSSLTFLTRVSVDELKVDRAFVAKMVDSPEAAAIVRTTVDLARSLGLRVVAEGVETADQRAALAALGCTSAQGFHFFRPMPEDKVVTVLRSLLNGAQARILPLRADGA